MACTVACGVRHTEPILGALAPRYCALTLGRHILRLSDQLLIPRSAG